jgi:hypothetical protein
MPCIVARVAGHVCTSVHLGRLDAPVGLDHFIGDLTGMVQK